MRYRIRSGAACVAALVAMASSASAATTTNPWVRPVKGPIVRRFIAPTTAYGPGHRGIDIEVPDRSPVGASGPGRVLFAGLVAGNLHVTVQHFTSGWVTGYSNLAIVVVRPGMRLRAGQIIGRSGGNLAHHKRSTLHFSLRIAGQYRDPEILFGTGTRVWVHLVSLGGDALAIDSPGRAPAKPRPAGSAPAPTRPRPFGLWWRWPVH